MARRFFYIVLSIIIYASQRVTSSNDDGPLSVDDLQYHADLDANYELKWNFNSTHIIFQTHVRTTGYIGFGISKNGGMYPSDVIIAWVSDGQLHFSDRHAIGLSMPPVDAQQDWFPLTGIEDGENTTITMIRQLTTCDEEEDLPIVAGTTRVIYSYSPTDPTTDDYIGYHGKTRRGTKSVLLFNPTPENKPKVELPNDTIAIDILKFNYSVSSADTTYACTYVKLPPLEGKHHLIRFEPVIQKGHEELVHHMILYSCHEDMEPKYAQYVNKDLICYGDQAPTYIGHNCNNVFFGWAIGGTTFNFPPHVGHPFGGKDDPKYFKLETHYNNVEMRGDLVDSSGMRLYLTKQLRQHDSATLALGLPVSIKFVTQVIPPHAPNFMNRGVCHQDCLEQAIGDDEQVLVFGGVLHAHTIARAIKIRQVRNGVEQKPILEDENYNFDFQELRLLSEERIVKKDDVLVTDCYYDSTGRQNITYGGLSTQQEMCLAVLFYYPKNSMTSCFSMSRLQPSQLKKIENLTFDQELQRTQLEDFIINKAPVISICDYANEDYKFKPHFPFIIKEPYIEKQQCEAIDISDIGKK